MNNRRFENKWVIYCCIMGAAGEHYALGLYLGSEGLMGISKILSGDFSECKEENKKSPKMS
jgi:hypothetical protein